MCHDKTLLHGLMYYTIFYWPIGLVVKFAFFKAFDIYLDEHRGLRSSGAVGWRLCIYMCVFGGISRNGPARPQQPFRGKRRYRSKFSVSGWLSTVERLDAAGLVCLARSTILLVLVQIIYEKNTDAGQMRFPSFGNLNMQILLSSPPEHASTLYNLLAFEIGC